MDTETAFHLWTVLFSSIGLGYFMYGKKQQSLIPLLCGLALMVYPYFVASNFWLVVAGSLLTAIPYFAQYL